MSSSRPHWTLFVLACICVLSACGDAVGGQGAICTPPDDATIKDCVYDGRTAIFNAEHVRDVCNARCDTFESLTISGVDGLENLKAFSHIETIRTNISIARNSDLQTTEGLGVRGPLKGGGITIRENPELNSLTGFSRVSDVNGTIIMRDNKNLISLNGLENIRSVGGFGGLGGVELINNGLNKLDAISGLDINREGAIRIQNEDSLQSLAGLPDLDEIGGVWIEGNDNLQTLDGLTSIGTILYKFRFENNPTLPTCLVDRFRKRALSDDADPVDITVTGNGGYSYPSCSM
jgi:hypothetical protein